MPIEHHSRETVAKAMILVACGPGVLLRDVHPDALLWRLVDAAIAAGLTLHPMNDVGAVRALQAAEFDKLRAERDALAAKCNRLAKALEALAEARDKARDLASRCNDVASNATKAAIEANGEAAAAEAKLAEALKAKNENGWNGIAAAGAAVVAEQRAAALAEALTRLEYAGRFVPVMGNDSGQVDVVRFKSALDTASAALAGNRTSASTGEDEVRRLKAIIERERDAVAVAIASVRAAFQRRAWLRDGRGSYEYDDEKYQGEFGAAIDDIEAAMQPMDRIAHDLTDCPTTWADVRAARATPPAPPPAVTGHEREIMDSLIEYVVGMKMGFPSNDDGREFNAACDRWLSRLRAAASAAPKDGG